MHFADNKENILVLMDESPYMHVTYLSRKFQQPHKDDKKRTALRPSKHGTLPKKTNNLIRIRSPNKMQSQCTNHYDLTWRYP